MQYSFVILSTDDILPAKLINLFEDFPSYLCSAVFKDTQMALKHIKKHKTQLVFIQVPANSTSNQLLFKTISESLTYLDSFPYFVALADDASHALTAINAGCSDYINYDLDLHQWGKILFKFEKRTPEKRPSNICIKSYSDYQFVNLEDIVYLKADNNTTDIQMINGKVVNAYKTLKHFENSLPFYFLRIHKSYIVNINHVSRIHFSKSKCYINYNQIIPFSTTYRENIDAILRKIEM